MVSDEGIDDLLVYIMPIDRRWTITRITQQGELLLVSNDLPDSAETLLINLPYLHKTYQLDLLTTQHLTIGIAPTALPVMLP